MQYIQLTFTFDKIEAYQQDLLINELAEIGFNTFEETENGFAAFIDFLDYSKANLADALSQFEGEIAYTYTVAEIAAENWNEEWEKNFEPLIISEECYVRATFHPAQPQYAYEIVIDPKMAFGTGHHQTTTMMMQYILSFDVKDKTVLDMGCGTGILAILASKRGAKTLVAIDNDEVCYQSTLENAALNDINNITALCGGKEVIQDTSFDVILANINRNILLDQIATYAAVLNTNGSIFFSGFYESPDLEMIKEECQKFNIRYTSHQKINDWVAAHFIAIGGSAMHNLAIALHKKGFKVSGSDDVIAEPSKSRLDRYGLLPPSMGWNEASITPDLDAVILGMHAFEDNLELLKAKELGLKIYSYPEYIYEQTKDKLRVVIGGSHGKTTITSMILHVLNFYKRDFDYLVGAQLEGFDTMVKVTEEAPIIIIEGDEYLASPIDRRPKFHLYKANIAVISGIAWDHINVFPTFEEYILQFDVFINTIQPKGKLIYCQTDEVLAQLVKKSVAAIEKIPYDIPLHEVRDGVTYLLPEETPLNVFGDHNLRNLSAAKLVCAELGISAKEFNTAILTFKGAAKRLELLRSDEKTNVYKDFAHSPSKVKATIEAVKSQFVGRKLVACIEMHTFSSLNKNFLLQYESTMDKADFAIVYINEHTFKQKKILPFSNLEVQNAFKIPNLQFFNDVLQLQKYLLEFNFNNTNLLLMSSGNFGGLDLVKLARELST